LFIVLLVLLQGPLIGQVPLHVIYDNRKKTVSDLFNNKCYIGILWENVSCR